MKTKYLRSQKLNDKENCRKFTIKDKVKYFLYQLLFSLPLSLSHSPSVCLSVCLSVSLSLSPYVCSCRIFVVVVVLYFIFECHSYLQTKRQLSKVFFRIKTDRSKKNKNKNKKWINFIQTMTCKWLQWPSPPVRYLIPPLKSDFLWVYYWSIKNLS